MEHLLSQMEHFGNFEDKSRIEFKSAVRLFVSIMCYLSKRLNSFPQVKNTILVAIIIVKKSR